MPLRYPTVLHENAANDIVKFFDAQSAADTALVVRSCARGTAVPASDLDMVVLYSPDAMPSDRAALQEAWTEFRRSNDAIRQLCESGQFAAMHLQLIDGIYEPSVWDDNGGPDDFEVRIGNDVAYSVPIGDIGPGFRQLQEKWLPYYDDDLRDRRLAMAVNACRADLDCVGFYLDRDQYFQAFDRLYKAFQEYLQALCIANRTYSLGYDRWVKEQVSDLMGLPETYARLPEILQIEKIDGWSMMTNVAKLRALLAEVR